MKQYLLLMLLPLVWGMASCSKEISVTSSADVQSDNSVVLTGYANEVDGKVGFCYSSTNEDPTPENSACVETSIAMTDTSYVLTVKGLSPVTKYYYRAYATKDQKVVLSRQVKCFITEEFKLAAAVDLGLSVKWATFNVGATSPEECGDYFAWGETTAKTIYNWGTYKYCNGNETLTKYCTSSEYGVVDNKTVLDPTDDAATANWGGAWRMPTKTELDELSNNCTWTWTTQNGVEGFMVTGKNGNSIFLPDAGCRFDGGLLSAGGNYWSSSLISNYSGHAYSLYFTSGNVGESSYCLCNGLSVRPVCQ